MIVKGVLSCIMSLIRSSKIFSFRPLALFSPLPVMTAITAVLQAILASPRASKAFLSLRPVDEHALRGLQRYSNRLSPGGLSHRREANPLDLSGPILANLETAWRVQILCALSAVSVSASCNISDTAISIPPETLRRASRNEPHGDVASAYYAHAVGSLNDVLPSLQSYIDSTRMNSSDERCFDSVGIKE